MVETTDGTIEGMSATIIGKRSHGGRSGDNQPNNALPTKKCGNSSYFSKEGEQLGEDDDLSDVALVDDYSLDKADYNMDLDHLEYHHPPILNYLPKSSESSSESELGSDFAAEADDMGAAALKHSERLEAFPNFPIYDECMSALKDRMIQIPVQVLDLMRCLDPASDFVQSQAKRAKESLSFPTLKKIRIALLGDAGKGKSSLINSLTDIDDIARSLSGGSSCTCVPTEYHGPFKAQIEPFAAQIIYYSNDQIRRVFTELISDYNTFNFEADPDWDASEKELYQKRAHNALDIFISLFRCDILTGSKDDALQILKISYTDDKSRRLLDRMLAASEQTLKSKVLTDVGIRLETIEASTVVKLRGNLDPLIAPSSQASTAATWPLVKQVKIGVRGPRILEHVALVDLPGISDTNQLRVRNCHDYIKTCDELWAIASIARVVDDGTVHHLISRYGKLFKGRVAVIATCIDEGADCRLAAWLKAQNIDLKSYHELTEQLNLKKKGLTELRREMKRLSSRPNEKNDSGLERFKHLVMVEIPQAEQVIEQNASYCLGELINARNHKVKLGLQETFDSYLPEGMHMMVFCVSNLHYAAAKGQKGVKAPRLCVDATGVPVLRKYVLSMVAQALLENAEDYIYNTLGLLIKDLSLWIEEPVVPYQQELLQKADALRPRYGDKTSQRCGQFDSAVDSIIGKPLDMRCSHSRQHAVQVLKRKRKQRHCQTILAFIRHFGNWGTKACPKESWNEQFARLSIETIIAAWPSLKQRRAASTGNFLKLLSNDLKEVTSSLDPNLRERFPVDRFQGIIDTHVNKFKRLFSVNEAEYEKSLRNILLDVTVDSEQHHFSSKMRSIYQDCQREHGPGMLKRSLKKIERSLAQEGPDSPFMKMQVSLVRALKVNDKYHIKVKLGKQLRKTYASLHDSFSVKMLHESVVTPAKKLKALEALESIEKERVSIIQALGVLKGRNEFIKQEDDT